MIRKIFTTDDSTATMILRLVLGAVFFAHGAQKMLGWFGGYGYSTTMGFFTGMLHIPAPLAFLAIAAEFFGGLGLILGLPHTNRGVRNRRKHGRCDRDRAWRLRILHELERRSERRGLRVSPSGARVGGVPHDSRGRRLFG
jgi:hypothetical protein